VGPYDVAALTLAVAANPMSAATIGVKTHAWGELSTCRR
jgi:hypothetical protein